MEEPWEPFFTYHVEHIRALQHGGTDDESNLALACHHCNLIKGPNLASIDPDSGLLSPLFHPRMQTWKDHFKYEEGRILGITAAGRTSVFLMQMNASHRVELRQENELEFGKGLEGA